MPEAIEVWTERDKSIRIFHGDLQGHGAHERMRMQIIKGDQNMIVEFSYTEVTELIEALTKWFNEECCNG